MAATQKEIQCCQQERTTSGNVCNVDSASIEDNEDNDGRKISLPMRGRLPVKWRELKSASVSCELCGIKKNSA